MVYQDRTFCINDDCPFTDCDRHYKHVEGVNCLVSLADFSGTCRRYITWLVDEVKGGAE